MSFAPAALIAFRSACENPPPPQELLRTRMLTPACFAETAQLIALIASLVEPEPFAFRNFRPVSLTLQLTPTTPVPLSPTAPIVPETCVPWSLLSAGLQLFLR